MFRRELIRQHQQKKNILNFLLYSIVTAWKKNSFYSRMTAHKRDNFKNVRKFTNFTVPNEVETFSVSFCFWNSFRSSRLWQLKNSIAFQFEKKSWLSEFRSVIAGDSISQPNLCTIKLYSQNCVIILISMLDCGQIVLFFQYTFGIYFKIYKFRLS